jgi:hypothetical protein
MDWRRLAITLGGSASLSLVACTGSLAVGDDDDTTSIADDDSAGTDLLEDLFVQSADAIDILFVVDNSASMLEEQNALQSNFWYFIQHLTGTGVDYHIGITVLDDWTTQPEIGALFGSTLYIDPDTEDPVGAFAANMTMGVDGMGSCEVGLEASYRALTEPLASGTNVGFYRDDARLTVVVVSDEPDGSTTGQCPDAIAWTEYVPWITTLKGVEGPERIHFAAIVGDVPDGCYDSWGQAEPGRGYQEVAEALGPDHSTFFSICESDWSPVMSDLGVQAASAELSFPLSSWPDPATLQAHVDPDGDGATAEFPIYPDPTYSQPYAYVYVAETNSLDFSAETRPPVGAVLRVTYEAAGS